MSLELRRRPAEDERSQGLPADLDHHAVTWSDASQILPRYASSGTHVGTCAYAWPMASSISVRDLRNTLSEALRRVEGGERLTVTVDRRPVAEIVPLRRRRTVPAAEALAVVSRHAADRQLLEDVRSLWADTTDDV